MPRRLTAPFPDAVVAYVNAAQDAGQRPAYLCPTHDVTGWLVAATDALSCPRPGCPYTQDWVWWQGAMPFVTGPIGGPSGGGGP